MIGSWFETNMLCGQKGRFGEPVEEGWEDVWEDDQAEDHTQTAYELTEIIIDSAEEQITRSQGGTSHA